MGPGLHTVTISDNAECETKTKSGRIKALNPLSVSLETPDTLICYGVDSVKVEVTVLGGVSPYQILWNNGDEGLVTWAKKDSIAVIVSDASGCFSFEDSTYIDELSQIPPVFAGNDEAFCDATDTVQLRGNFTGSCALWVGGKGEFYPSRKEPEAQYIPALSEKNSAALPIHFVSYNTNGCPPDSDEVVLYLSSTPYLTAQGPSEFCDEFQVHEYEAVYNENITYDWHITGGTLKDKPSANEAHVVWSKNRRNNELVLTMTDSEGCETSQDFGIIFNRGPLASFQIEEFELRLDAPINFSNLSIGENMVYSWYLNDEFKSRAFNFQSLLSITEEIEVLLEVVDSVTGCMDQHFQLLSVDAESYFKLPNAFTPNGDGINDGFKAFKKNINLSHIQIFNRWGELVYESNEVEFSWDGTHKNEDSKLGVYTYIANASDVIGNTYSKSGVISLIR
ncbi:MAG: gliding motility-associated-like protein [Sphingobacteriales bacterium]